MLKGVVEEVEIREFQEKNSDLLPMVDLLKQLGFYTDCSGKCRWHDPRKIVDLLVVPLFFAVEKIILGENTLDKILSEKLLDAINDRMLD
jgi:hypothetical protein